MGHEDLQYERLLTPAEVAATFRVDVKTVSRWAKAGKITALRTLGGHRRYRESEVTALLNGTDTRPGAVTVTVAARHILAGDIRNPARHPIALAISETIARPVTVTYGSATVLFRDGGGTVDLPEVAAKFKRALESGEPVSPVTFVIAVPSGERAA
jgi:excisionase family DNA binding protein